METEIARQFQRQMRKEDEWVFQERALVHTLSEFGYTGFFLGVIPDISNNYLKSIIFRTNMDMSWRVHDDFPQHFANDYSVEHCAKSNFPLLWSEMHKKALNGELSEEQHSVLTAAEQNGFKVGVSLPLRSPRCPVTFGLGLCVQGADDFDAHDRQFEEHKEVITDIAYTLFYHADFDGAVIEHFNLTPNNIRTYRMLALGYDRESIAAELNSTDHGVKYQLRNVREKMGTDTVEQALSLFVSLGLSRVDLK